MRTTFKLVIAAAIIAVVMAVVQHQETSTIAEIKTEQNQPASRSAAVSQPSEQGVNCTDISRTDDFYLSVCKNTLGRSTTYTEMDMGDGQSSLRQISVDEYNRWITKGVNDAEREQRRHDCKDKADKRIDSLQRIGNYGPAMGKAVDQQLACFSLK
ncbi:MAG: hypothetical protein WBD25_05105 [Terriglobales bacterium]